MPNSESSTLSPLVAIRDKERALAQEIRAAEERANAMLVDARARADAVKQQAEREGLQAAEALYQEGLAGARDEAEAISRQGEANAVQQRQDGLARIDDAVNYIVNFVLPHQES
ncbi:MAG TPA: V-type ATPase subunit subunit G family protein [Anaerolineae bacterium]